MLKIGPIKVHSTYTTNVFYARFIPWLIYM